MIDSVGVEILSQSDGVAASTGAACYSGMGAIRFSLGRTTTIQELERVVQVLKNTVPSLVSGT